MPSSCEIIRSINDRGDKYIEREPNRDDGLLDVYTRSEDQKGIVVSAVGSKHA